MDSDCPNLPSVVAVCNALERDPSDVPQIVGAMTSRATRERAGAVRKWPTPP